MGTNNNHEIRKHRLVANTLKLYDLSLYYSLLQWFKDNMYDVANFCFSKRLAKNECDWANVVWYKNEIGENKVDDIFIVDDLCNILQDVANKYTFYGSKNGGSTITLPFGHVQWHSPGNKIPGMMQFHHINYKIKNSINNR